MDHKQIELTQKMIKRAEMFEELVVNIEVGLCTVCHHFYTLNPAEAECDLGFHRSTYLLLQRAKSLL